MHTYYKIVQLIEKVIVLKCQELQICIFLQYFNKNDQKPFFATTAQ